jgi:hypothetical protein
MQKKRSTKMTVAMNGDWCLFPSSCRKGYSPRPPGRILGLPPRGPLRLRNREAVTKPIQALSSRSWAQGLKPVLVLYVGDSIDHFLEGVDCLILLRIKICAIGEMLQQHNHCIGDLA